MNKSTLYTIGTNSTDVTKFIYDPEGELVATVKAPDDNAAGIKFARDHAERILKALNTPEPDAQQLRDDLDEADAERRAGCSGYNV